MMEKVITKFFNFCKAILCISFFQLLALLFVPFIMDSFWSQRPALLNVPLKYEKSDDRKHNGIVKIGNSKGKAFCSGYVASKDYIITAGHCLTMPLIRGLRFSVTILDADNNIVARAKPAGYNTRLDYGIIRGDFKDFKQYESEFYKDGFDGKFEFMACGFPFGQKVLNCTPFKPVGQSFFRKTGYGMLVPAMSGGPVIDVNGRVIAVNSAVNARHALVTPLTGILALFGVEP